MRRAVTSSTRQSIIMHAAVSGMQAITNIHARSYGTPAVGQLSQKRVEAPGRDAR